MEDSGGLGIANKPPCREREYDDNQAMDIQSLSVNMAQGRVQEEAAVKVQAMVLQNMKDMSADLARLMESSQVITDPAMGNYVNMFA